ncbi:carboxymuconolactone decarboxylase family protein [Pseudooceanicola sp. CBS1P-1]|uniref:4-carboxymuconolactone decarboxylase n=1 Tax=Pseudooceanicola albus TaxID=2692189 RepID=A0A6L7FYJ8_9RHOB|nr:MULTISPECIES: carboxymuconolactone decarboxylase family protein [Pseudooceanicola]MBT9382319.1 carboxymuconolactone decarboxylase family protein [Pseudooceanicola endophyticus]MXN16861.1 4-carboxymuconolactone decarboxylase [Pseudooceanicola albus]
MPRKITSLTAASALSLLAAPAFAEDPRSTLPGAVAQVAPALAAYAEGALFDGEWAQAALAPRDRALVTFATLVTRHEADTLAVHAALALDAGVTPAELSETITQLAFYTGLGNATAAAQAIAPVFAERGIAPEDLPGATPGLLPLNEAAEAAREATVQGNFANVSPGVVANTREVLFLDLWRRPGLAPRDRSLVTVAALIAAGQPAQMTFHLNRAMDNGLTQEEAGAMLSHLAFYAGWPRVFSALPVAKQVFEARTP